jgi:protein-tyrosine phosphatase
MIDLHTHTLPGIDDGASTLDVTIQMLNLARHFGATTVAATPHLHERLNPQYRARVFDAFDKVSEIASPLGIELISGFEVSLAPDLANRLERGEPVTLGNSNAVLVDVPFVGWPLHAESSFFNLQAAGFRPILAHPERYEEVQRNPKRALDLVDRGVLLQVTTGSFAGIFGGSALTTAEHLLRESAVHVVASDAHSAGQRFMAVEPGLSRLLELVGDHGVERLTTSNPRAILANEPVDSVSSVDTRAAPNGLRKVFRRLSNARR